MCKNKKKLLCMINQAKLNSHRTSTKYMFGYEMPHNYARAMELDKLAGNTKWATAIRLELNSLLECDTFLNKSMPGKAKLETAFKRIRVHMVYTVKQDGRHKARLVADGNLTQAPLESVYSGVVSLRGIRLVTFLSELNGLSLWATDIGNAYLEAKTREKVFIIAGPEFGDLQGHVLVIFKALYGLRTSGKMWHELFSDVMRSMGFTPSRAEPDIWMRARGDHYEYIAVYVDDRAIASRDPEDIVKLLVDKHKFKLKGTGPISYHLGMEFFRDKHGVLCISAKRYVEKMLDTYKRQFGKMPPTNNCMSPLADGDHPELDDSEYLTGDGINIFQSLIGALQWAISMGRMENCNRCHDNVFVSSCAKDWSFKSSTSILRVLTTIQGCRNSF